MFDTLFTWSLLPLIGLGIFHGINPGMGWLFAVALGMQERRLGAVVAALGPIALGHALAIGIVALAIGLLGTFIPAEVLLVAGGLTLLGFAGYKIATRFRHPRWVGMRVSRRELVAWSFLMATAHGAGLMLIPVLVRLRDDGIPAVAAEGHHAHHATHHATTASEPLATALTAVAIHSAAMLGAAALLAVVVYRVVGVGMLRRAWVNLDLVWVGALIVTGGVTLLIGLTGLPGLA
jgi:hypothetical protein